MSCCVVVCCNCVGIGNGILRRCCVVVMLCCCVVSGVVLWLRSRCGVVRCVVSCRDVVCLFLFASAMLSCVEMYGCCVGFGCTVLFCVVGFCRSSMCYVSLFRVDSF